MTLWIMIGAVAALTGPQEPVATMLEAFTARRAALLKRVADMPGVKVHPPQGAFYAFLDLTGLGERGAADGPFAEQLLEQAHVAAVPGFAFGAPGHLRVSFACSMERLQEGLDRLARFVSQG